MLPHTDGGPPPEAPEARDAVASSVPRRSPPALDPGLPLPASIAQRRLQRRPMGLSLGMDVGMAGIAATASAALLGAGSDGPPPTARGSWTMDSRDASPALQPAQGARWGDSAPPTPGLSIPGSQGGLRPSRLMDIAGNYSLASSTGNSMGSAPFSVATVAASAAGSLLTRQRCADPQPSSLGAFNAQAGRHSDAGEYKGQLARSPQAKSPRMKSPGRVSGLSYISAADMAMRLSEAAAVGRQGVIIDTRRSADYVRAHITDAANMCVSSTLAKRKTFTIDRLLEMQRVADEQRRLVTGWKSAPWVVLYSDGLPEQTAYEDTQLVLLARKFTAEAPDGCEVHVLQCGFDEFARSHGSLCTSGGAPAADAPTIRPLSLAATMPASTASAHRVAMGRQSMACPPPPPTLMIDHPMLRTMRQTPGGGGFDPNETVAMRLPHDFSSLPHVGAGGEQAPQRAQALPAYLCRAADPATGPALLTRLFGRIDASETRRMSSMIENNGMVTEKNSYTISVGLELGSKNRYTNIYPFDSNRVRLRSTRRPHEDATAAAAAMVAVSPPMSSMSVANDMGSPGCSLSTAARPISFGVAQGTKPCRADSARRSSHRVESKSKGQLLMGEAGSISSDTELFGHEAEPGSDRSDYVNASYISYFDGPLYIATQGPLPETVGDFWRMVWEERAQVVVMLTKEYENGRPKCHRYWPSQIGHTAMYGELCVEWQVEAHHPDDASIIARRFRLSQPTATAATVCVTHLQYVGWPDHGVPENPLGVLRLIHLARRAQAEAEQKSERGPAERIPMVVHCSAGCGRTGAFCAIDTVAEMASVDANGDTPMSDLCNPPAPAAMATSPNRHSVFTGMVPQALRSGGPSATPGTGGEPATQQGWGPGNAESSDDGRFRRSLTQWDEKPPADLHSDLVFMVVSRFRELRITMVQTLRQFVFCHEALAWMALNAGPRPIDQVIDRRLVAEWNRVNYPNLSEADCVDISLLLRGRQEMVQAMLRSEIGGTTKGGAADAVPAKSSMAGLPGGRASIDIVGGGGMPLGDDSPIASRPPAVKRSNTVGPARRGFLASMFQLVAPASGSVMDTGRTAHAPIAEEEPMAVDAADAVHMSLSMSPAPPQESPPPPPPPPLPPPLATSTIHEPTGDDYFGLASARIGLQASRANPDLPVAPGGGWRWNGGGYMAAAASPRHSFYYPMAGMSDDTPPTSPAYASSTALASPSAQ